MKKVNVSKALENTGEFISKNKKPLLYIGGAVVVVIVGVGIVKGIKGGINSIFDFGRNVKNDTPFSAQKVDVAKITISSELAKSYATQLYNAMKNSGTDEGVVYDIFSKINGDDFKMIYNEFGQKSYYVFGEPTISSWLFGYDNLDLVEWLKKEISIQNPPTYLAVKKVLNQAGFSMSII